MGSPLKSSLAFAYFGQRLIFTIAAECGLELFGIKHAENRITLRQPVPSWVRFDYPGLFIVLAHQFYLDGRARGEGMTL